MSSLLHQTVPVWQLLVLVTFYVIYKELVKLGVKLTYKRLRDQHNAKRTARAFLGQPADESPQLPAPTQDRQAVGVENIRPDASTRHRA